MSKYILWLLLFQTQMVFASGWCDYDAKLPNGYKLVRTNADSLFIVAPTTFQRTVYSGWAIPSKIVRINVYGSLVVGELVFSANADMGRSGPPGFFILDTGKHTVQLGLDKQTWLSSLNNLGIKKKVSLKSPGSFRGAKERFDYLLGTVIILLSLTVIYMPILLCFILGICVICYKFYKKKLSARLKL